MSKRISSNFQLVEGCLCKPGCRVLVVWVMACVVCEVIVRVWRQRGARNGGVVRRAVGMAVTTQGRFSVFGFPLTLVCRELFLPARSQVIFVSRESRRLSHGFLVFKLA